MGQCQFGGGPPGRDADGPGTTTIMAKGPYPRTTPSPWES
jgi:hypothetical protein